MANFCNECGKPITGKFCSNCGTSQQQAPQQYANKQSDYHQPYQNRAQPSLRNNSYEKNTRETLYANDEINSTIRIFGKSCRVNIIIRTIAIILCVFFFLPYFSVHLESGRSMSFTDSFFDQHFGIELNRDRYSEQITFITYDLLSELDWDLIQILNGSIFAILLILIPAALFAIYNFYRFIQFVKGKLFFASTILSIAGLLINILYAIIIFNRIFTIDVRYLGMNFDLIPYFSFWFYFAIVLYVSCIVISLKRIKKKTV